MTYLATWFDAWLTRGAINRYREAQASGSSMRWLETTHGSIRVSDSGGGDKPVVVLSPDGPNVIEHYSTLIGLLSPHCRVVCFDMPGFGFSAPSGGYDHSLFQGASAIEAVLDGVGVDKATLALSCANGFYAIRFAQLFPHRVERLVLSQTPSLNAMHLWTHRIVPSVLKVPVLGQFLSRLFRQKMARGWYHVALPKDTAKASFQSVAAHSLRCGSCFSLAGVVQGLLKEPNTSNRLQAIPCTVVWGSKDRSHSQTLPSAMLDDLPHAKIVVFDDCGHFPDLEQPERLADILLETATIRSLKEKS